MHRYEWRGMAAMVVLLAAMALWQAGCSGQCAQIKQDYDRALTNEVTLSEEMPVVGRPSHIGVGMRYDVVSRTAQRLLGRSLDNSLNLQTKIPIGGGKTIPIALRGDAIDLSFEADKACEECFRLVGSLGGDASVTLPLLGERKVPVNGDINLVAPLVFARQGDGRVQVDLDMSKIAEYSSTFIQMEIEQLPEAIRRALKQPLTDRVFKRLAAELKPVKLFSFKPPTFGVEGLQLFPSQIKLLPEKRTIFVGFASNLSNAAALQGLNPDNALAFDGEENFAVALKPSFIVHVVSVLLQRDVVPRRYTFQGQANPEGSTFVTMRNVAVGDVPAEAQSGEPVAIGFRGWQMGDGPCFWFDALVTGLVSLQQGKLKVALEQVELENASVAPNLIKALVDWKKAEFLDSTKTLLEKTLTEPAVEVPGGTLVLAPKTLTTAPDTLTLRSKVDLSFGGAKD